LDSIACKLPIANAIQQKEEKSLVLKHPTTQTAADPVELVVESLLRALNLPTEDPNFLETPRRVAKAFAELTEAVRHPERVNELLQVSFPGDYNGMIVIPDIPAIGLCPHHMLPVEYLVSFGYLPSLKGGVIGLSKIPRFVQFLSHQPILQETYTKRLVELFVERVRPEGVGVIVYGEHACVRVRGVKANVPTITSHLWGVMLHDPAARAEFLQLHEEAHHHHR